MRFIKYILLLLLPIGAHAQLLTNNGAVLSVATGSVIVVNGDVLNQGASGMLDNNGILILSGDFTHNAPNNCFGNSAGEVGLNGGAQTIGGSSVAVFNYLELAGTGTKTLLQDVEVGGAYAAPAGGLFVNAQNLDLGTHQLTVRNADPTAITRSTGFIVSETDPNAGYSWVRWNIGANTGNYTIPFGSAATNAFLPFTANITGAGTGATGHLRMATYPTITLALPNNRPLPAGMPALIDVTGAENAPNVLDRWWIMEAGDYATAPVASVGFTYRDSEWSTGTNMIVEAGLQLERQQGTWSMLPTVLNTGANTLTASGVPLSTSIWTAAEIGSPLPVELLSFTGERVNEREVMLTWSTATEHNNAGFEMWRMIEGEEEFSNVAWVEGAGESQAVINYALPDDNTTSRMSYYKLKQVDHDGHFAWSAVVAVDGSVVGNDLVVYPNPARDRAALSGLPGNVVRISMMDAAGRFVRAWSNTTELDNLDGFERGVYTVVVEGPEDVKTLRLVLE
ncbi:MAG: T9SS type A sorting domain-containing protein [Flavobacteriales bacterium]|nr:MAG: T9SS type A sorting domain-containing protein [Flavobacteriales bacterium]